MSKPYSPSLAVATGLCASMLALAACNQQQAPNTANAPASSATAAGQQQAAAYTPPTADQLYQMVAPIALFPDKLVAQVLAGSTYPDQITAAQNLLTQNPNLKGDLLQAAVEPQSWDPSVKGLTQFPSVLGQMAQNIQWTTALGQAYVNDPTDVLNAIQVMRQRATAHGNLRSSAQQQINTQPVQQVAQPEDANGYADNGNEPPVYDGPAVVPPPAQIIQIEPAQSDAVYVPSYDPQTVYGGDVPVYPSYQYEQPSYSTGEVIAVGAVAFGAAIIVGSMLDHHREGGWHSWGMNWGGRGGDNGGGYDGGGGGWHRPAVVYNNQTYVSRSTTVVNRYTNITNNRYNTVNNNTVNNNTNNINNSRTFNNTNNSTNNTSNVTNNINNSRNQFNRNVTNNVTNNTDNRQFNSHNATNNNQRPAQPMSMPNFGRAGYPPAAAPHVAPEVNPTASARPAQAPHPAQMPHPNVVHQPPPNQPAPARPAVAPRPQESFRQPTPAFHPAPQPQPQPAPRPAPPQERPQPVFHPAPQPAFHPAQPPAFHPAPPPAPRPAPAPQPMQRPAPPPVQHAPPPPPPRPQPQPQAHPAPPQHQPPPPPKKKDESQH
ncbi:hypothetical protein GCM10007862_33340 [Dyella lipolytica]|uniref:DUF3300 domain-containing protein n=1 Tax=Dyella lipolytica TaxID=1867835 RepID=UPI00235CDE31|nr:DUF3300 domain-containing protein [Dyella lipolytica]GLQ48283.1 hypothetical protein GCM10007862_33340 [Dyella lipolytica]